MKIKIIETRNFLKVLGNFFKKKLLLEEDFDSFKKELAENPKTGDIVIGTGGVRKIRLKSFSKGKRSGFRVCYYYFIDGKTLYLLLIYAKNEQENLTIKEKKSLKELVSILKMTSKDKQ